MDKPRSDLEAKHAEAVRRAQVKVEFYRHLVVYAIVIAALCAINLVTAPGYLWFVWPAAGWGIGLLVHFVNVFVLTDKFVEHVTERELRRQH